MRKIWLISFLACGLLCGCSALPEAGTAAAQDGTVSVRISAATGVSVESQSRVSTPSCLHPNLLQGSDNPSFWTVTDDNGNPFPAKITALSSDAYPEISSDIIHIEFLQSSSGSRVNVINSSFDAFAAGNYEMHLWHRASSAKYYGYDTTLNGKQFGIGTNSSTSWNEERWWLSGVGSSSGECKVNLLTWGVNPGDWIEVADINIGKSAAWSKWQRNPADERYNALDTALVASSMVASTSAMEAAPYAGGTGLSAVVTDASALPGTVSFSMGGAMREWEAGQDYTVSFRARASSPVTLSALSLTQGFTSAVSVSSRALTTSFKAFSLSGTASSAAPVFSFTVPSGTLGKGGRIEIEDIVIRRTSPSHSSASVVSAPVSWEDGEQGIRVKTWTVVITSRGLYGYTVYDSASAENLDLRFAKQGSSYAVDGTLADLDFGEFDVPAGIPLTARVWINAPWPGNITSSTYVDGLWMPNVHFVNTIGGTTEPMLQYYGETEFVVRQDGGPASPSVNVPLSRLDARVVISSVDIDLPYPDCRVGRYFVANVPDFVSLNTTGGSNCSYFYTDTNHLHNWIAVSGKDWNWDGGRTWGISNTQTDGDLMYIQPDYYEDTGSKLWPLYVNPTLGDYSPLVFSVWAGGTEYYYRVTLPSLQQDHAYRIALRVTRLGSPDPDDTDFSWNSCVDVVDWETGWEGDVSF